MIVLRRLGGELIALNPDLIERVEATPDTVVTLLDEKKFLIEESLDDVLRLITDYRAFIIARSREISVTDYDPGGRPVLQVVPDELVASGEADGGGELGVVRSLETPPDRGDDLGGGYA